LDLVFTSEPDMVDTVSVLGNLGSSDHNILYWTVHISRAVSPFDRPFLDYHKGDYSAMRQALSAVDWTNVLQGDANNQWTTIASILKDLESKHTPLKKSNKCNKKAPGCHTKL